jgi:ribosomal protein L37E
VDGRGLGDEVKTHVAKERFGMKYGFEIEITCRNCGSTSVNVLLDGAYQVMKIDCNKCDNESEESV